MPRLSCDELRVLRTMLRADRDQSLLRLVICGGTACRASGSGEVIQAAQRYLVQNGLVGRISLQTTGCHGFCEMGPFLLIEPQQAFYAQVKPDQLPRIIAAAQRGEYVEELLYRDPQSGAVCRRRDDIPFFKNQQRTILGMSQKINPTRLNDYIAEDGYAALADVLLGVKPETVVRTVKQSGLRGRGGGGFPTGLKWEMLARQPGPRGKVIVCNADEGDAGAYMDRCILEGNPHSIIEGMTIGAYGTGATEGIVYVRNEYPLAIENLSVALRHAREHGLLGDNILGTGFCFDIRMVRGAGAFVCGEETALIRSVEGKMGEPRQRPPYPVKKGVNGKPTAINNVETWANVPVIIREGAAEFARVGTKNNAGTKIFSLVGKIRNTGLVEVPMGVTIGKIVYDIGGGPVGKARIKAVQTGGPSGGCIPAEKFDLTVNYDSLAAAGSIMGSGGMIVMDEDNTCMVDVAKYFMGFLKDESCGKCFTCRKGTQRMYEILDDITKGRGTLEHLDLLEELALAVKDTTMCGLGQTAANPVLSTLRYFRHDLIAQYDQKLAFQLSMNKLLDQENIINAKREAQGQKALDFSETNRKAELSLVGVTDKTEEYTTKMELLNAQLAKNPKLTKEITDAQRDLSIEFLRTQDSIGAGLTAGLLEVQKQYSNVSGQIADVVKDTFSKSGELLTNFFAGGLRDVKSLKKGFEDMADSILKQLTQIALQEAILKPLTGLLLGDSGGGSGGLGGLLGGGGGGGGGGLGGLLGGGGGGGGIFESLISGIGGLFAADGFDGVVSGRPGKDTNFVPMHLTHGERVTITPAGSQGKGDKDSGSNQTIIQFNISTPDADSFRKSQGQIMAQAAAALDRQNRRNN